MTKAKGKGFGIGQNYILIVMLPLVNYKDLDKLFKLTEL